MCSYVTVTADVVGSAKGPDGWFSATSVAVYFDHPYHASNDHTLNIDFTDASRGPSADHEPRSVRLGRSPAVGPRSSRGPPVGC